MAAAVTDLRSKRRWLRMIQILIACDIRIYREGLAEVLALHNFQVNGAVEDVEEAARKASEIQPEIVLLDMAMPRSYEAVRAITEAAPAARVVALCVPETENHVISCAEAGVAGYVSREASLKDLVDTIESAARGEIYCSPTIVASLFREMARRAGGRVVGGGDPRLTSREREILALIDLGLSNKEIASALHIALSTVKNHVHNILEKCHVHRRLDAVSTVGPEHGTVAGVYLSRS